MTKEKLPTHTDLCRSVGKINAYLRADNKDSARQWATILVDQLIKIIPHKSCKYREITY